MDTDDDDTRQPVGVDTFLDTIFGDVPPEQGVVALSYPGRTPDSGWRHRAWVRGKPLLDPRAYFFPTTLVPDEGRLVAGQRHNGWTFAIVLDDVGETLSEKVKVEQARITLPPSWIIESSPGCYQYGYILTDPIPAAEGHAVVAGLAAAGLTDPRRPNGAAQVMRLPGSHNAKYSPPFAAVLHDLSSAHYTPAELAAGLGFTIGAPVEVATGPVVTALAPGEVDPVEQWLEAHGMFKGPVDPRGWRPMICPWGDEHSKGEQGTDYIPGKPGAFSCLHTHGLVKRTAELHDWIRAQDPAADLDGAPRALVEAVGEVIRERLAPGDAESLRARMAAAIEKVTLHPGLLPTPDISPAGKVSGRQTVTEVRVERVLNLIGAQVRHNAMTGGTEAVMGPWRSSDEPSGALAGTLFHACVRCGMVNQTAVDRALAAIAVSHAYHPVEDWIRAAAWDGRDRFEELLGTITLAEDTDPDWARIALRKWLVQGAYAFGNFRRGTPMSVPYVLVLQGPERRGKSKWVNALLPAPWVGGGVRLSLDGYGERDAARKATRTAVTELAELDASFKRTDQSGLKNFLSTTVDVYRDAYAHREAARPRCTIFAATVNPKEFLMGQEGESRFWPLGIKSCNWQHTVDMQQVWAQAMVLADRGAGYDLEGEIEWSKHAAAVEANAVQGDVARIVADLKWRRERLPWERRPKNNWVHATSTDLCAQYGVQPRMTTLIDLNSALRREGFESATVLGKRGHWLPPYSVDISTLVKGALKLVE